MLLLLGAVARAQPTPNRTHRQRSISVSGNPADPLPEVRGAKGIGIAFHFDGLIREESIKVDESRIRVVDVGKKSLLIEPVTEPQADQPSEVSVTFADGEQERAAFRIVPHPSEVDTWIEVTRQTEQPGAACQARIDELRARCGAQSPTAFRRSGLLPDRGILARTFERYADGSGGLVSKGGVSFRGSDWALVDVEIMNPTRQPWAPRVATFKSKDGTPVTVRLVTPAMEEIPPGTSRHVLVETDDPPAGAGVFFTLEVSGADGRFLRVGNVELAPRPQEGKR
ncbi:MAG TPA: DUF2381 family protein [Archangium sp.]|uniref:DUF2381 family protein n=1 Tax=Archangium sp. TaxID=1872627 RepID=UPI002E2F87B0|nr:DUF2381 family protein [Archangium sp.]HEX5753613.1 DUF2381 family protein [Archangium sp.]